MAIAVVTIIGLVLGIIGSRLLKKDDEFKDAGFFIFSFGCFCFIGVSVALLIRCSIIAAGFLNPEYWALRQIIP